MNDNNKISDKLYCDTCKIKTNHSYVKEYSVGSKDQVNPEFNWIDSYYITKCLGCDTISFYNEYSDEDMVRFHNGELESYSEKYVYPQEPISDNQETREQHELIDTQNVPEIIETLYRQIVCSFDSGYYLLAAVGLRMIVEGFCNDLGIQDGPVVNEQEVEERRNNLQGKINGMLENEKISSSNASVLHQIRKLGNVTVHELENPESQTVLEGIKIIENLITSIYLHANMNIIEN